MKHQWKYNKCTRCGLKRKRRTCKHLLITLSRGIYQYMTIMAYYVNNNWTFIRPECETHIVSQETTSRNELQIKTQ
jgi:hypothetical protein